MESCIYVERRGSHEVCRDARLLLRFVLLIRDAGILLEQPVPQTEIFSPGS